MKQFALVVRYETGSCVFLTDTPDIQEALDLFEAERRKQFDDSVMCKSFALPRIISAEILKVYYS